LKRRAFPIQKAISARGGSFFNNSDYYKEGSSLYLSRNQPDSCIIMKAEVIIIPDILRIISNYNRN